MFVQIIADSVQTSGWAVWARFKCISYMKDILSSCCFQTKRSVYVLLCQCMDWWMDCSTYQPAVSIFKLWLTVSLCQFWYICSWWYPTPRLTEFFNLLLFEGCLLTFGVNHISVKTPYLKQPWDLCEMILRLNLFVREGNSLWCPFRNL